MEKRIYIAAANINGNVVLFDVKTGIVITSAKEEYAKLGGEYKGETCKELQVLIGALRPKPEATVSAGAIRVRP